MRWILLNINVLHNSCSPSQLMRSLPLFWFPASNKKHFGQYSLYLVLVWMEQFSGQTSATRTGLNKLGQHSNFAQTLLQKSATWSDVRTILTVALYVFPLYLEKSTTRPQCHQSSDVLHCYRPNSVRAIPSLMTFWRVSLLGRQAEEVYLF